MAQRDITVDYLHVANLPIEAELIDHVQTATNQRLIISPCSCPLPRVPAPPDSHDKQALYESLKSSTMSEIVSATFAPSNQGF